MGTALQLDLDLKLPTTRPLVPMKTAVTLLDKQEDAVLALIEDGHLAWAWDIRAQGKRREVRIWRDSLVAFLHHLKQPGADDQAVMVALLPHFGPELRSTEIQRIFSASQDHVSKLLEHGLLTGLNDPRTGPNGYVRVTSDSLLNFLRQRRMV